MKINQLRMYLKAHFRKAMWEYYRLWTKCGFIEDVNKLDDLSLGKAV